MPPPYPAAPPVSYATPAQPVAERTSITAILSLVCGIFGFLIVPGLIAIVLGLIALRKTRDPRIGGRGLAIAGLSVGAATMVLSGCMSSILLPSLNRARETANRVKCASNMRQIGQAILLYSNSNRGVFPPRLEDLLRTQPIDASIFVCPSGDDTTAPGTSGPGQASSLSAGGHLSYVYVGQKLNSSASVEAVVLYEPLTNHRDGANFLFADGHVEFMTNSAASAMIKQLEAGQNPPRIPPGGW
jgi:prepilin-type processing-associated H-X9-DG protein